ncbi:uncharacterized protein LOC143749558 [Siphateles boraxobius]|uniref:uncharacterized protein LOC143732237 n=1 Tax=Siphateles boraxobius TaxID=180520 RepID=UPI004063C201
MDPQRLRNMDVNQALAFFDAMEDDGFSGEERFLTDEELDYQNRLDPAEDCDNDEDTSPPTQARQESSHSSTEEGPSTSAAASQQLPGIGHGRLLQFFTSQGSLCREAATAHDPQGFSGGADSPTLWCYSCCSSHPATK